MFSYTNSKKDIKNAELFINDDYFNCPYLYANLVKYGVEDNKIKLFIDNYGNDISTVALLYYDCLHVYYHNDLDSVENIKELVNLLQPRTIFLPSYRDIEVNGFSGYSGKEVIVMSPQGYSNIDTSMVNNALLSDVPRISEFMYSFWNDVYESSEIISKQIAERIIDNYGRTKYIESDREIVSCVSSYAELENFAICGGLLVSSSQRGKKRGSVMLKSIYKELEDEGKKTCGIIVDDYSRIFHEKNGFAIVGKLYKFNKITE